MNEILTVHFKGPKSVCKQTVVLLIQCSVPGKISPPLRRLFAEKGLACSSVKSPTKKREKDGTSEPYR